MTPVCSDWPDFLWHDCHCPLSYDPDQGGIETRPSPVRMPSGACQPKKTSCTWQQQQLWIVSRYTLRHGSHSSCGNCTENWASCRWQCIDFFCQFIFLQLLFSFKLWMKIKTLYNLPRYWVIIQDQEKYFIKLKYLKAPTATQHSPISSFKKSLNNRKWWFALQREKNKQN